MASVTCVNQDGIVLRQHVVRSERGRLVASTLELPKTFLNGLFLSAQFQHHQFSGSYLCLPSTPPAREGSFGRQRVRPENPGRLRGRI